MLTITWLPAAHFCKGAHCSERIMDFDLSPGKAFNVLPHIWTHLFPPRRLRLLCWTHCEHELIQTPFYLSLEIWQAFRRLNISVSAELMKPCRWRWSFVAMVSLCSAGWFFFLHRIHSRLLMRCPLTDFCPSECAICMGNNDWWTWGSGGWALCVPNLLFPLAPARGIWLGRCSEMESELFLGVVLVVAGCCFGELASAAKVTREFKPLSSNLESNLDCRSHA